MTSYVKNRNGRTKTFFQKVKLINLNNFFYDSSGLKGIQNGQNWSFCQKMQKRRLYRSEMTSYVKNGESYQKNFFAKYPENLREQLFLKQFCPKTPLNGSKMLKTARKVNFTIFTI